MADDKGKAAVPKLYKLPPNAPTRIGVVLFPQFEPLDVFGPVEVFLMLSRDTDPQDALSLTIITEDGQPASSGPWDPSMKSRFGQDFAATKSYDQVGKDDLDVLLVPGGPGTGDATRNAAPAIPGVVNFIARVYPGLKHIISVCTGSALLALAGVLDGKRATTNKFRWFGVTPLGPKAHWVAQARWVESREDLTNGVGKVWTTSGVSAGTDGVVDFIQKAYGKGFAYRACQRMEYIRVEYHDNDPFAEVNGVFDDVLPTSS